MPTQEGELTTTALIVVQGLATGSLLYVVFFEILEKERQKTVPGVLQVRNNSQGTITNLNATKGTSRIFQVKQKFWRDEAKHIPCLIN